MHHLHVRVRNTFILENKLCDREHICSGRNTLVHHLHFQVLSRQKVHDVHVEVKLL
jgi:hypothetical protein